MKNPDLFQGEEYFSKNKNYFEGWYFKNTNSQKGISFIPGINIDSMGKKAFIQIITNNFSYFVNYNIEDFTFDFEPFSIKIGNNLFSKTNIHIEIEDISKNLSVYGDIKYSNSKNIATNLFSPNIMGPFSYVPFMECNHAILSMQNTTNGLININNEIIKFDNDKGYIEKDWGCSFPKSYIWCEGNNFQKSNASFMFSIADVPLKLFTFRGIICVCIIDNKEYKFTTYNNAKLMEYKVNSESINITLKKDLYTIKIETQPSKGQRLIAPLKGKMEKNIIESISSNVKVTLKKQKQIIFSDTSKQCGLEITL